MRAWAVKDMDTRKISVSMITEFENVAKRAEDDWNRGSPKTRRLFSRHKYKAVPVEITELDTNGERHG